MDRSSHTRPLLLQIARCPNLGLCACANIAAVQDAFAERQVPEPWNGDLASAPIMFVSSNPSISEIEDYPTDRWDYDAIVDFFEHRIRALDGRREQGLRDAGKRGKPNPFLSSVRMTDEFLLEAAQAMEAVVLEDRSHSALGSRPVAGSRCRSSWVVALASCSASPPERGGSGGSIGSCPRPTWRGFVGGAVAG